MAQFDNINIRGFINVILSSFSYIITVTVFNCYLFLFWQSNHKDMNFNIADDTDSDDELVKKKTSFRDENFSNLEAELKSFVVKKEVCFLNRFERRSANT